MYYGDSTGHIAVTCFYIMHVLWHSIGYLPCLHVFLDITVNVYAYKTQSVKSGELLFTLNIGQMYNMRIYVRTYIYT